MYRFGDFTLDPERLELRAGENLIDVQPQVFSLIAHLIANCDRVVTKDEIIDEIWDGRIVSDGTLNARINAARRALDDDGKDQKVIRTFPRRGFRFVAAVCLEAEGAAPAAVSNSDLETPAVPLAIDRPSIAVLPFDNLSNDPDQEFFADGLTEDLITDLSKNTDLFVIARNSSFAYKGTSPDVREVGQALGVAHVLEGSVRKAGTKVRINAQLADAITGGHIWAERYDSDMDDIFALQDEITAQIVSALKVNLAPGGSDGRTTDNAEAYEFFLRARSTFYRFTPAALKECVRLSEQAITKDPNFADAWAGMVFPHQSGWSFMWKGYDDAIDKALEVAKTAVNLAPGSSLCQSRLGWVSAIVGDHETASTHFERAIEIAPNDADAHAYFADALSFAGDPERGIDMVEKALEFDPFIPPNCAYHMGHALFLLERHEEAEGHVRHCIEIAPGFPPAHLTMTALLAEMDRTDEAREQVETILAMHPHVTVAKFNARYPYADDSHRARILTGLRSAGLPEE